MSSHSQFDSPSPSPSSPTHDLPSSSSQPPRKRARTEVSSEERKEARAHRNRIAAQNSRDRRKAQFSYLERRVAELEDENRRLRAGIPVSPPTTTPLTAMAPPPQFSAVNLPSLASLASVAASAAAGIPMRSHEEELRMRREQERERENEELKERIKTLERGWDAVVKALAAQGLPTGISPSSNDSQSPTNNASSSSPSSSSKPSSSTPNAGASTSQTTPSTTSSPVTNLSLNGYAAFPSPAPSHSSLDLNELDLSSVPSSTPFALQPSSSPTIGTGGDHLSLLGSDVPAAGGFSVLGSDGYQSAKTGLLGGYLPSPSVTDDDGDFGSGCDEDAKMEDLFREIFVESGAAPTAPAAADTVDGGAGDGVQEAAVDAGAAWRDVDAASAQAEVVGAGKVGGEAGRGGEGPTGSAVEGSERQQREMVNAGEKRKRENDDLEDDASVVSTSMSDEEMQRMLSEMEVSMMMGDFDPSLVLPVDTFGTPLDAGLVGFNDVQSPFMEYAAGCQDFGMWATPGAAVLTGVF
ncbi:hypothetical protein FA13DRAFT_1786417 [Coprinellus micaceus]|uniref:X-box-binding protein 1 n=1 Tax=Coprinellus micaceus TaxID=71717 RepID=A0A4Y7TST2_COPMI|nr:hypothetical protein FA13DRAFT_1786417 [Coprinellus micaceus]